MNEGEVVEPDRVEKAITEYNQCVRRIKAKLTPEEMIMVREHPERVPLQRERGPAAAIARPRN